MYFREPLGAIVNNLNKYEAGEDEQTEGDDIRHDYIDDEAIRQSINLVSANTMT